MAAFHPRPEDLPAEFPVFPLPGALLLPRGKLPLNIFEPRYKAMVEDALGLGRMFGMIQPDPTAAEGPTGPSLFRVGCVGRLSEFSETGDGRYLINLTGVIRFAVASEIDMRHGYRRVIGDYTPYLGDLDLSATASEPIERDALLAALRGFFTHRNIDANWDAIRRLPDEALVLTLSMVCPFEPAEKQALLEASTEADRASILLALLRMGAAGPDVPAGRPAS
jgi:Lon protease-like protein